MRRLLLLALLLPTFAFGAIAERGTPTLAFGTVNNATDITVTKPTGVVDDDFMFSFCANDNSNDDVTDPMIDGPAGWTYQDVLSDNVLAGRGRAGSVETRVAATEGASYLFGHNNAVSQELHCAIAGFSGVDTTTPLDVVPIGGHLDTTLDTTTPQSPAITTVTNNAWVVSCVFTTGTVGTAYDPPTGYTEILDADQDHTGMACAYKEVVAFGLETPGTWTHTSGASTDDSYAVSFALRPAAAASNAAVLRRRHNED